MWPTVPPWYRACTVYFYDYGYRADRRATRVVPRRRPGPRSRPRDVRTDMYDYRLFLNAPSRVPTSLTYWNIAFLIDCTNVNRL